MAEALNLDHYAPYFGGVKSRGGEPELQAPVIAKLRAIADTLLALDERYNILGRVIEWYGMPAWNYSLYDEGAHGNLVTVPFVGGDSITLVLQFYTVGTRSRIRWASRYHADNIALIPNVTDHLDDWFNPISKMLIYDAHVFERLHMPFQNWLDSALVQAPLRFRNCYTIEVVWYGYYLCAEPHNYVPCASTSGLFDLVICDSVLDEEEGALPEVPPWIIHQGGGSGSPSGHPALSAMAILQNMIAPYMDNPDCLEMLAPELIQELVDLLEGDIMNPCFPQLSSEDIIVYALNDLCEGVDRLGDDTDEFGLPGGGGAQVPFFGLGDFYDALDGTANDRILFGEEICARVKCIFELLIDLPYNESYCNTVRAIDGSQGMVFNIHTRPFDDVSVLGRTTYASSWGYTLIEISSTLCDDVNPIKTAATILHESVHGFLIDLAVNNGYTGTLDIGNDAIWLHILNNLYGGNHHEFMVDALINNMAETLRALNGYRGVSNDYVGVVMNGLAYHHDNTINQVMYEYYLDLVPPEEQNTTSYNDWIADYYNYHLQQMDVLEFEITLGDDATCP